MRLFLDGDVLTKEIETWQLEQLKNTDELMPLNAH